MASLTSPTSLSSFLLLLLVIVPPATPATPPPPNSDYVAAHNEARAAVGVGPLTWSDSLAKTASLLVRYQRNNKACGFANVTGGESYGANQLFSGGGVPPTPRAAVGNWVAEGKFYNHSGNSCAAGHRCGVYTQVVWKNTTDVGCSIATCPKEKTSLTICLYFPPGNYVGESPY